MSGSLFKALGIVAGVVAAGLAVAHFSKGDLSMSQIAGLGKTSGGFEPVVATSSSAETGGLLEKITPDIVGRALDDIGLKYSLETDPRGQPMIVVDISMLPVQQFNILFFECNAMAACEDVTLWSWYRVDGPVSETGIMEWNDPFEGRRRWSVGYLDQDQDPALFLNINATGGIGERALQILVNTYIQDIFEFRDVLIGQPDLAMGEAPESERQSAGVSAYAMLSGDLFDMTGMIKKFGGGAYRLTKETDIKH